MWGLRCDIYVYEVGSIVTTEDFFSQYLYGLEEAVLCILSMWVFFTMLLDFECLK